MNTFTVDGSWNQIKGKLRQKFAQLTDDDLNFAEGKSEELWGHLQTKLGMGAEELYVMLNDLKASLHEGRLREKMEQVKTKASEIADGLRSKAAHYADDFKATASMKTEQLKTQAEEAYKHAKMSAANLHEAMSKRVRRKPRESMLAALAAGFVLGLMIRR